jgi:hypothetical protein
MRISIGLVFSLLGLVAVGIAIALGATFHSSAVGSRLVILAVLACNGIAIVFWLVELKKGRSTLAWIRLALPTILVIGAMSLLS